MFFGVVIIFMVVLVIVVGWILCVCVDGSMI